MFFLHSSAGFYRRPIEEVSFYPKIPVQPIGFGHAEEIFKSVLN